MKNNPYRDNPHNDQQCDTVLTFTCDVIELNTF